MMQNMNKVVLSVFSFGSVVAGMRGSLQLPGIQSRRHNTDDGRVAGGSAPVVVGEVPVRPAHPTALQLDVISPSVEE